ncbi:uracil-DNA glycosylase [Blattabacterium cuenoti]|uniref:uracil-DNA glycosylase n=1 Tax=Blattabacterium cuenoti TaxID=1653831 RepID=UPI00163C6C50|nr:uracil-DNA glycosylase [Blattabacterium cuenoti]
MTNFFKREYSWNIFLQREYKKHYFQKLMNFLSIEYQNFTCYPKKKNILLSLKYCSFQKLKVVLLGQDPYYNENQADGLCFSVPNGVVFPPSLKNIFTEIKNCLNPNYVPYSGSLVHWAKQGILLLNSILTVRKGHPHSHKNIGWEFFTDQIIRLISNKKSHIVFLLWGKYAMKKYFLINSFNHHYILTTSHPSPLSAHLGFFGSQHFLKTNIFLKKMGKSIIYW